MRPIVLSAVFVAICSAPLAAQIIDPPEVAFTGVVEPATLGWSGLLCAPPTHQLACSVGTFYLVSSTIDLNLHLGQNVKLYGKSLVECPVYNVHKVETPPPATLAICGTSGFGCTIRLRSGPGGLTQHVLFAGLAPGLMPLSPFKGSFLLADPFFVLAASGAGNFPPEGAAFDFGIPVDTALQGLRVYFQAARRNVGPVGPMQLSNAVCLDIVGFVLLCHDPNC